MPFLGKGLFPFGISITGTEGSHARWGIDTRMDDYCGDFCDLLRPAQASPFGMLVARYLACQVVWLRVLLRHCGVVHSFRRDCTNEHEVFYGTGASYRFVGPYGGRIPDVALYGRLGRWLLAERPLGVGICRVACVGTNKRLFLSPSWSAHRMRPSAHMANADYRGKTRYGAVAGESSGSTTCSRSDAQRTHCVV